MNPSFIVKSTLVICTTKVDDVCILVLQPSFYSAKNNTKNSEVERILLFVATSGCNNKLFISTKSLKFYTYPQKDRYYLK